MSLLICPFHQLRCLFCIVMISALEVAVSLWSFQGRSLTFFKYMYVIFGFLTCFEEWKCKARKPDKPTIKTHITLKQFCGVDAFYLYIKLDSAQLIIFVQYKQNRSTEACSKLKRSVDMTSSGKNGINIRTNASPKWDRTRCPEE